MKALRGYVAIVSIIDFKRLRWNLTQLPHLLDHSILEMYVYIFDKKGGGKLGQYIHGVSECSINSKSKMSIQSW
jgi:hypothetical protein